jgi:hypothetical protein
MGVDQILAVRPDERGGSGMTEKPFAWHGRPEGSPVG